MGLNIKVINLIVINWRIILFYFMYYIVWDFIIYELYRCGCCIYFNIKISC